MGQLLGMGFCICGCRVGEAHGADGRQGIFEQCCHNLLMLVNGLATKAAPALSAAHPSTAASPTTCPVASGRTIAARARDTQGGRGPVVFLAVRFDPVEVVDVGAVDRATFEKMEAAKPISHNGQNNGASTRLSNIAINKSGNPTFT
jgi:hypothetical protein